MTILFNVIKNIKTAKPWLIKIVEILNVSSITMSISKKYLKNLV